MCPRHLHPKEGGGDRRQPHLSPKEETRRDVRLSRLQSLLSGSIDPGELHDALNGVPESALRRYSGKFFASCRALMDNMESRHGWGARKAFAKFLSEAVRNEAFSADFEAWLRHMDAFARELGARYPAYVDEAFLGCAKFAAKCRGTEELRSALRQVLYHCNAFGHPGNFLSDVIAPLAGSGMPADEIGAICSTIISEMEKAPPERRSRVLAGAGKSIKRLLDG